MGRGPGTPGISARGASTAVARLENAVTRARVNCSATVTRVVDLQVDERAPRKPCTSFRVVNSTFVTRREKERERGKRDGEPSYII